MKYTVDRFEGNLAVLLLREDEARQLDMPRDQLPEGIREGDLLDLEFDASGNLIAAEFLKQETDEARTKADELLQKLLNRHREQ